MVCNHVTGLSFPFCCPCWFLFVLRRIHFYEPLAILNWTCLRPQKKPQSLRPRLLIHSQNLVRRRKYRTYSVHQRRGHPRNSHLRLRASRFCLLLGSWLGWVNNSYVCFFISPLQFFLFSLTCHSYVVYACGIRLQLMRLGVNLKNFPSLPAPAAFASLFHAGIGAVLLLYVLFWIKVSTVHCW